MLRAEMVNKEGKKIRIRELEYSNTVWVFNGEECFDSEISSILHAVRLFRRLGYEVTGA